MAKIFISYSGKDKDFTLRLAEELRKYEHDILMDDTVLEVGREFQPVLQDALKDADVFLVLLTKNSLESKYVMSEIGAASATSKHIIPLVYGDSEIEIPGTIRNLHYEKIN